MSMLIQAMIKSAIIYKQTWGRESVNDECCTFVEISSALLAWLLTVGEHIIYTLNYQYKRNVLQHTNLLWLLSL